MVLKAYWPLDEASGDTAYDVRGNNNGTLNGGITQGAAGILGESAYGFDGTDDYINCGSGIWDTDSPHTVSFWIKTSVSGSNQIIIDERDGNFVGGVLYVDGSTNSIRYTLDAGSSQNKLDASTTVTDGSYYFVTGVWDGNTQKIYINAEQENAINNDSGTTDSTDTLAIGVGSGGTTDGISSGGWFDGQIQHVRIWDHALTQSEIQYLYQVSQRGLHTSDRRTL